jgi:probable rRNA maturation factor
MVIEATHDTLTCMSFCIVTHTRKKISHPYEAIKNAILGNSYDLTLVFIGTRRARALNLKHRKASYIPNVLSFPLTHDTGEIYITPQTAQVQAKKYGLSEHGYIGFLFIHGLLHLKGYPHGDTMEKAEKKYIARYHLI